MTGRRSTLFAILMLAAGAPATFARPAADTGMPRFLDGVPEQSFPTGRELVPGSASAIDTVWYGGTAWAPDSMRWEALRDSVWTFDTGVGSSINTGFNPNKPVGYHQTMEGWFGIDQGLQPLPWFRRSTTCAINGSYSAWAGVTEREADSLCYTSGQGYGDSWNMYFGKTFAYPGSGNVTFGYDYAVECEASFDYAYVWIDTTANTDPSWAPDAFSLVDYTGTVSGTESFVLIPGLTMRSTPGPFSIWFNVTSDGAYSDEDGLNATVCGHSAFDDITLSGAINEATDFESGSNGWSLFVPVKNEGDLGDYSHLAAWADLPDPVGSGQCSVQDSVLVFFDLMNQHPFRQDNIAVSPWIDLKRGGDTGFPGRIMSADLVTDLPIANYVFVQIRARYFPYACSGTLTTTPFRDRGIVYYFGESPFCTGSTPYMRDYSGVIGPEAEQVQVAWGVASFCRTAPDIVCATMGNTTPYIDNIRFGVYGMSTSAAPEPGGDASQPRLAAALPNPSTGRTTIAFTSPAAGARVTIRIFDVMGRIVRTLLDQPTDPGRHEITWDGTTDDGASAASGLYFYRMDAGSFSDTKRLVLLR